jgi:hypothetical protein
MASPLERFLRSRLPRGLTYVDAAQVFLYIFSVAEAVPKELAVETSKQALASAFASLAAQRWILPEGPVASSPPITDAAYWQGLVSAMLSGNIALNLERGKELLEATT